jgi:hypothetical protein
MTPERIPLQRIKVPFDIWNQRLRKGCELHDRVVAFHLMSEYVVNIFGNDAWSLRLIPPRSLVEVDTSQDRVQVFQWHTARERPIYLVWHDSGYCCCWCQVEGRELTLVPHPLSQFRVRRLKMPHQANVIGRVTNAWLHFQPLR